MSAARSQSIAKPIDPARLVAAQWVVLPEHAVDLLCHWKQLEPVEAVWTPEPHLMKEIALGLMMPLQLRLDALATAAAILGSPPARRRYASEYFVQCVGIVQAGRRLVSLNGFLPPLTFATTSRGDRSRTTLVRGFDFASRYFRAEYDTTLQQFVTLRFDGRHGLQDPPVDSAAARIPPRNARATEIDVATAWTHKNDARILAAAAAWPEYTVDAQLVVRAQMQRRGLSLEAAHHCPHCGFWNTADTGRCDCGWDFLTSRLLSPTFVPIRTPHPTLDQTVARNLNIGLGLLVGAIGLRWVMGNRGPAVDIALGIAGIGHLAWALRQVVYAVIAHRRTASIVSSIAGVVIALAYALIVVAMSAGE